MSALPTFEELRDYFKPRDRSFCTRCRRFVGRLHIGPDAVVTAYCHGSSEERTFALSYLEDRPTKRVMWFAEAPSC